MDPFGAFLWSYTTQTGPSEDLDSLCSDDDEAATPKVESMATAEKTKARNVRSLFVQLQETANARHCVLLFVPRRVKNRTKRYNNKMYTR